MTRRVVILEPDLDGHHAFWLAMIVEAHRRAGWAVELLTAADTTRLDEQARMRGFDLAAARRHACGSEREPVLLEQAAAIAARCGAERVLVAFIDRFWNAILDAAPSWRTMAGGAKLAGIWFHPHALDAKWRWAPPVGKRWKIRGRLHRFLRSGAAADLLDSLGFLVDEPRTRMRAINPAVRTHSLPDPYEREPRLERAEARRALGLPSDRTIFLHLGSAERRKGLPDVLEAFSGVAQGADGGAPLLLRVGENGRLRPSERASLDDLVVRGKALAVERFVGAEELMEYFSASDWVLIPYRKFRYSSGILANAVGALRPVVAADHGHIGLETARLGVGVLYPHGSVAGLAKRIAEAAATPGRAEVFSESLKNARPSRSVDAMLASLAACVAASDRNQSS